MCNTWLIFLFQENITILAEFINSLYTVKDYFLDSPEKGMLRIISQILSCIKCYIGAESLPTSVHIFLPAH